MSEVLAKLKALRLYGMADAWTELADQGGSGIESVRGLIEHLVEAEEVDRAMRSIRYPLKAARFPVHRDLAGFDFSQSRVDEPLISDLANLSFTETAENLVFIGGTETGKSHLATALGISGITGHGRRVRFFSAPLIWSIPWSRKRPPARPDDWRSV